MPFAPSMAEVPIKNAESQAPFQQPTTTTVHQPKAAPTTVEEDAEAAVAVREEGGTATAPATQNDPPKRIVRPKYSFFLAEVFCFLLFF